MLTIVVLAAFSAAFANARPLRSLQQDSSLVHLALGGTHSTTWDDKGEAWAWGSNDVGQLAINATTQSNFVPRLIGGGPWAALAAGASTTCGIKTTDGSAWCGGANDWSQLGSGFAGNWSAVALAVVDAGPWAALDVGVWHVCGVKSSDRSGWCWGRNDGGQLGGSSDVNSSSVPLPVAEPGPWRSIVSGGWSTCGIKEADSSLWCWGKNFGQLGTAATTDSRTPVLVEGGGQWSEVDIGSSHVCGIKTDQTLWCFGQSGSGQLGAGSAESSIAPVEVAGGGAWTAVAAGTDHTVALRSDGALHAWGWNAHGQLGIGSADNAYIPQPVVSEGAPWREIKAGWAHSCGVKANNTIQCWGLNSSGQLSINPGTYYSLTPVAVAGFQQPTAAAEDSPSPSSPEPGSDVQSTSSSSNVGAIVGGVIGGVVVVAGIAALLWYKARKAAAAGIDGQTKPSAAVPSVTSAVTDVEYYVPTSSERSLPSKMANIYGSEPSQLSFPPTMPEESALGAGKETDKLISFIVSRSPSEWNTNNGKTASGATLGSLHSGRSSGAVDISPWEFQYSEMKVLQRLGSGSFGSVYKADWNGSIVALKILLEVDNGIDTQSSLALAGITQEKLMQEASLMGSLRHPHCVQFLGFSTCPPAIATELCARGSLYERLQAGSRSSEAAKELTWQRRLSMAADAARGMIYLHTRPNPIVHRDIKSPNLLVSQSWSCKIGDLGLSKIVEAATQQGLASTEGGTRNPRWLAPELLLNQHATTASDVYSFGTVLWELATWKLPWGHIENPWKIISDVIGGQRLPLPAAHELPGPDTLQHMDRYVNLMHRCWAQQPEDRPAFQEILAVLTALD